MTEASYLSAQVGGTKRGRESDSQFETLEGERDQARTYVRDMIRVCAGMYQLLVSFGGVTNGGRE